MDTAPSTAPQAAIPAEKRPGHVAIIIGVSGRERFLGRVGEVEREAEARRFRSLEAAARAARGHLDLLSPVIRRSMAFRVEPRA